MKFSFRNLEHKCDCKCHLPEYDIRHMIACCHVCPICNNKIKWSKAAAHKKICHSLTD